MRKTKTTNMTNMTVKVMVLAGIVGLVALLTWHEKVMAHCDTMKGPVILEAKAALEKGDVTLVLKWVEKDKEAEIKAAFANTIIVRDKGPEARELADNYFFETLVRIHRAGEGVPYTGLKDTPIAPIIVISDKALTDGSADEMIKNLSDHLAEAVREKFNKAAEAKANKDNSVEAGREFVEAYVQYTHYVAGIHAAISAAGVHLAEDE